MNSKCPVCGSEIPKPKDYQYKNDYITEFGCTRCGDFNVFGGYSRFLPALLGMDNKKIAVLSHWIRTKYESVYKESSEEQYLEEPIILDKQLIDTITKQSPPNPTEQANNLILWLGKKEETYGKSISLELKKDLSIIGSVTPEEFIWVIRHLSDSKFIDGTTTNTSAHVMLSFKGWQYFEELKRGTIDSRKAFMAMEYGNDQLDGIVEDVFKPAIKQTGFDLFKLVDRPKAGLIDDRLRVEIQTSRFLIADLTHENAGAYWEAGYAEGLGKPVIYTCEKEKFEDRKTHFDTNHHLTVLWDSTKLKEAAEELKATIRATLPGEAKIKEDDIL